MKKLLSIGALIALFLVVLWGFSQFSTGDGDRASINPTGSVIAGSIFGERVEIDKQKSTLEFEGYTPVKSHVGTFDDWSGNLIISDDKIVGVEGAIKTNSVNTGIAGLDKHLKAHDFFNANAFPEITFTSTNIDRENIKMSGELTFRGVTKEITFPISINKNAVSAEFFLDTTPFNMENTAVNKEVRIKFYFSK